MALLTPGPPGPIETSHPPTTQKLNVGPSAPLTSWLSWLLSVPPTAWPGLCPEPPLVAAQRGSTCSMGVGQKGAMRGQQLLPRATKAG